METFSTHILDSPSSRGLWNGYVCPNDYWWLQPPTSARVYTLQINGNWLSKPQLHIQARRHLTLLQFDRSYSLALAHPGFFLPLHKHTTAACIKSQDRRCPLHFLFPARIAFASHLHVHPPFPLRFLLFFPATAVLPTTWRFVWERERQREREEEARRRCSLWISRCHISPIEASKLQPASLQTKQALHSSSINRTRS